MNPICELLKIKYPIIQGGMVWVSGANLAASVSNAGGLGVIGAGSMNPKLLDAQIKKAKSLSSNPIAVNFPLLYSKVDEQIQVAIDNDIKIFITSAGSPKKFTQKLKDLNKIVMHVVSSPGLAKKCQDAGVDIVIAEGFEAGGHNGRDEITTMCLIPQTADCIDIPIVAAGGIVDHRGINAAMALGASGAQMGTRFLMTQESGAHQNYKELLLDASFDSTKLSMKSHIPVRLFKNEFFKQLEAMEKNCATVDELVSFLGKGRAKRGMHDGDLVQGELEIGQGCSMIKDLPTVKEVFDKTVPKINF